jgi:hypothetical protein
MDVEKALASGDVAELLAVWEAANTRETWVQAARVNYAAGRITSAEVCEEKLATLPDVSMLDALRASRALVERLTGRRWYVMQAAREQGATWEQIGAALGMSRQGAQDWYARKIHEQETHVGSLHDTYRARAALDEDLPAPVTVFRYGDAEPPIGTWLDDVEGSRWDRREDGWYLTDEPLPVAGPQPWDYVLTFGPLTVPDTETSQEG